MSADATVKPAAIVEVRVGESPFPSTWQHVSGTWATWQAVKDNNATWAAVATSA